MYLMSPRQLPLSPSARQTIGRAYRFLAFLSGTVKVDHIISDSRYTANQLRQRFGAHLPPITVVRPGLDDAFFKSDDLSSDSTLRHYGLRSRSFFLHPGAVDPRKNTAVVLKAFSEYRAADGDADLVIVGLSPGHRLRLEAQFQNMPGLRLLPFVDNEALIKLLLSARALVYVPSAEGFGYPLAEAMALGTPAIASAIEVLDELGQGVAWTVPAGSVTSLARQMLTLDRPSTEMVDRVIKGRQRALQLTSTRAAEETIQVYERMAESTT
jgi:glycosyltransferase involved in cell wall biosynthesis